MNIIPGFVRGIGVFIICVLISDHLFAHNGKFGYAYPLGKITIDGNLSDWPIDSRKYYLHTFLSDNKPKDSSDFNGFFQMGYRLENKSFYLAVTITDDNFIEDSSTAVQWNSQDGLELYIDARHLQSISGVASFMYSKTLRNINKAYYDPFSSVASWDMIEVVMKREGNLRIYEWRVILGDQFEVGKSIGIDLNAFDLDTDKTFSFASWGKGGQKFRTPGSLADVILLPSNQRLATVSGQLGWDKETKSPLPGLVRFHAVHDKKLWLTTEADSTGKYSLAIPAGDYEITLAGPYYITGEKVYQAKGTGLVNITAKAGKRTAAGKLTLSGTPAPDLIDGEGILLHYKENDTEKIDQFIETYRSYYSIPGVSLAIIKDGKLVYHKTYGVRNTFTQQAVDQNTLFEAASITKPVFAFAVQRLAEKGIIDLNKPLYEYLPYKDIEHDPRYKLITAKLVLTHRTGFPNWRDGKLNLRFTPDSTYGYSGEGFEYLKLVVEKITGKKVEQVLQEEVIEPMGLYHTFFSRNDSLRKMVAEGHIDRLPNYDELPQSPGMAWSMHTEAKVFTQFMLYLLEQKGLSQSTYESMFLKQSDYPSDPNEKQGYPVYMGMSLEIRESPFGKSFGHGGNNGDFKCKFEVYKDLKSGYVIFTNSNTSDVLLDSMRLFLVEGKTK